MIKNIKEYNSSIFIKKYPDIIYSIGAYNKKIKLDVDAESYLSNAIHYQWQMGEDGSSGNIIWVNVGDNKPYFEFIAKENNTLNKYYRVICDNGCQQISTNPSRIILIEPVGPSDMILSNNEIDESYSIGSIVGQLSTISSNIYSYSHSYEIVGGTNGFNNFELDKDLIKIKNRIFSEDNQEIILSINSTNEYGIFLNKEFAIKINSSPGIANVLIKNADFETENYGFSARYSKKNNISNIQDWKIDGFVNLYNGLFSNFDWLNSQPLGTYPYDREDLFLQVLSKPVGIGSNKQYSKNRIYQNLALKPNTRYYLSFDLGTSANSYDTIEGDGVNVIVENDLGEKILDTSVYYTDFNRATKVGLYLTTSESTEYTINFTALECSKQTGPLIGRLNLIEETNY